MRLRSPCLRDYSVASWCHLGASMAWDVPTRYVRHTLGIDGPYSTWSTLMTFLPSINPCREQWTRISGTTCVIRRWSFAKTKIEIFLHWSDRLFTEQYLRLKARNNRAHFWIQTQLQNPIYVTYLWSFLIICNCFCGIIASYDCNADTFIKSPVRIRQNHLTILLTELRYWKHYKNA